MGAQNAKLCDANTKKSKIPLKLAHIPSQTHFWDLEGQGNKVQFFLEANKWSKKCLRVG